MVSPSYGYDYSYNYDDGSEGGSSDYSRASGYAELDDIYDVSSSDYDDEFSDYYYESDSD
jgi:hypothetical protein